MNSDKRNTYESAKEQFPYIGELIDERPFGNGHINDTYLLTFRIGYMGSLKVILQRVNSTVFPHSDRIMANIMAVTEHLKKKIRERGGDPDRETLSVIPAKDGKPFYIDENGDCWRSYTFIAGATSYDQATPEIFYQSAVAFGNFAAMLADFPSDQLFEPIQNFHNTPWRYANLEKAIEEDVCGRAADIKDLIDFAVSHKEIAWRFADEDAREKLPLRVTHNDTKLNNVMIDNLTGKALCVIDLDTVMPGYIMNDFGDAIRFGASSALEDETDLSKVYVDPVKYESYCRGFLSACRNDLTEREIRLMPTGALTMTYECGIRFLTDYLSGDTYFKISHPTHNLERAMNQMKLVADMLDKWDLLTGITEKAAEFPEG